MNLDDIFGAENKVGIQGNGSSDYSWLGDIIKPAANFLGDRYQTSNQNSTNNNIYDIMMQAEQSNYDQSKLENDARNAARGSAAGAAAATDANRRAANQQAQAILKEGFQKSKQKLKPYAKAGKKMLPFHTKTAKGGLQGMDMLAAYMQSQPQLQAPNSLQDINVGKLPNTLFGGK